MSIAIMERVWETEVGGSPSRKYVLLALADRSDDHGGKLFPSMGYLARRTGLGRATVQRAIYGLIEDGFLLRLLRHHRSSNYLINLSMLAPAPVKDDECEPEDEGNQSDAPPHHSDAADPPHDDAPPHHSDVPPASLWCAYPSDDPKESSRGARASGARSSQPKTRPRSKLPDNWQPKPKHHDYADEHQLDLDREASRFRQHAEANGRLMANWDAAFSMWLDKARDMRPPGQSEDRRDPKTGMSTMDLDW